MGDEAVVEARPRFLADAMLGDVARWLRILGEDCIYAEPTWSDDVVLQTARPEDRVIVTRDTRLVVRARQEALRAVEVPQSDVEPILIQVYRELGLAPDPRRAATRCSLCNGTLEKTDAEGAAVRAEAKDKDPPRDEVRGRHETFWSCTVCGQPYWRGTHWENIEGVRANLVAALAER